MNLDNSSLLLLAAPAAMLFVSLVAIWRPGPSPVLAGRLSIGAAAFGLYIAAIGAALLINHGPMHSANLGSQDLGLSVGIDVSSMILFSTVALIAFYVVRLSRNRMSGYRRQGAFLGRLGATVASVQLLVLTNNPGILIVASTLAVLTLHGLLVFHRESRGAHFSSPSARLGSPRGI